MKSPSLLGWYRILRVHYQWTCSKRFGLHSDSAAKRHETPTLPAIAPNFARLDQRGPNKENLRPAELRIPNLLSLA